MNDKHFMKLVDQALDSIGDEFIEKLNNVAIVIADFPTREQLAKVKARPGTTLFGLYEGIPQTKRGAGYSVVLPDKITIFKVPILCVASNEEELKNQVRETVWHEIAHHFGMDHKQIHAHQKRRKNSRLMVTHMLEDYEKNKIFTKWPLHVTLLPWFRGDKDLAGITIRTIAEKFKPYTLTTGEPDLFGKDKQMAVFLVKDNQRLKSIHQALFAGVYQKFKIESKKFLNDSFIPHITDRKRSRTQEGQNYKIGSLQLVEAVGEEKSKQRKVIADFALSG